MTRARTFSKNGWARAKELKIIDMAAVYNSLQVVVGLAF
jgi:hypothetical protein